MDFKELYQKGKSFVGKTLVGAAVISTLVSGCNFEEQRRLREQQIQDAERQRQAQIVQLYESADGLATYSVPQVEIEASKISYTLDPFTHLGNAMKAQRITLPVSEDYFNSVRVGQELDSKFNTGDLLFEGDLSSYDVKVAGKRLQNMQCRIVGSTCQEVDDATYQALAAVNDQQGKMKPSKRNTNVLLREGKGSIDGLFTDSCDVKIRSHKTNFTLDIFKHITNSWNEMEYPVQLPRFLCDRLNLGDELDQNFVGGSLLFSKSPSWVTYKVTSIQRNYQQ